MQSTAIGLQNKFGPFTKLLRIMKVSALLLIIVLQAAARPEASAQVTLKEKSASLEKVLKAIKKQSDYGLVFDEILVRSKGKPVVVDVTNVPVETALAQVFKDQDMLTYTLNGKIISIKEKKIASPNISIQSGSIGEIPPLNIDVHGYVKDETGKPVVGASVLVKGTNKGTVTNDNGEFILIGVDVKAILIISAVNIETREVGVNGRMELNFTAKAKISKLEDVEITNVNTGYQIIPKERATGSFTSIDNKLLNRSVGLNILDRLDGVTSGLYVSKARGVSDFYIRGLSTINGATNPLIILDNFPYDGNINNINPNDVENISILKDAAASIWGARASNGVIVITTKKAKYNQPTRLTLNSNLTIQNSPDLYKDQGFLNSTDFIGYEKFLFSKGFYDGDLADVNNYPVISPVVELLAKQRAGILSPSSVDAQINDLMKNDVRNDYSKYVYRKAITQQNSLGLSGGGDKINYVMNFGFDKNQSAYIGDDIKRSTFYSAVNLKPIRNLEVNATINFTDYQSAANGLRNMSPGGGKSKYYPYARLADDAGNPLAIVKDYRSGYIDTAGTVLLKDWHYKPLNEINSHDIVSHNQELLIRLGLKYLIGKQISLEMRGQYGTALNEQRDYYSPDSYFARNLVNRYTNQTSSSTILQNIPNGGILDYRNTSIPSYNFRTQINYGGLIGKSHQLNIIGGAEIRQSELSSYGSRTYGYNDNLLTYSNVNYTTTFKLYGKLGSSTIPAVNSLSSVLNRYLSLYTNMGYTFKNRYSFSASVRKDASNLFGVSTNQKWNPFWSTGFAWKISDETFYSAKWLPTLSARITYGYSGNINNSLSALPIINYVSSSIINNLPYALATQPSNPDLRWERTGTFNLGVDFASPRNWLSGSIDYYVKHSTDLFMPVPIDLTLGLPGVVITKNGGSLTTKGMDVRLNATLINKKLRWDCQFLFNYVSSKVTYYVLENSNKGNYAGGTEYIIVPIAGKDPYSIISYRWGGLDPNTGDPIGISNGQPSKNYSSLVQPASFDDLSIQGTARPPYTVGFRNNFSYDRIGLSFNLAAKWGYYFRRSSLNYNSLASSWIMNSEYSQRWQKPGDELVTNVPSSIYPLDTNRDKFYNYSEATVEKGDNIRLQDIRLSYDLSPKKSAKSKIQEMQLFIYMNNIGVIWKANSKGIDPDYGNGTGFPAPTSTSVGFKVIF